MSDNDTFFDLAAATLEKGTPEHFTLELFLPTIHLAAQDYRFHPERVSARLSVIKLAQGYTVAMVFHCCLAGICWRCLEWADLELDVEMEDFFETGVPSIEEMGVDEEPSLWYSEDGLLNLSEWARDAVAELLPPKILCSEECLGLCSQCGANLNLAACDCGQPTDFRWDKLREWGTEDTGEAEDTPDA